MKIYKVRTDTEVEFYFVDREGVFHFLGSEVR